ncbi:uncharacterized protein LOC143891317 [Tasmannia lanceolata]|uniref:uncharacterized protein LOC143891317 n=1 Tax=Tasmannia lanceolata TaxID=3420 RepID=UPI00406421CE
MSTLEESSKNTVPKTVDFNNPLFLHHSDSPGTVLVSQVLNGENYSMWSRAMIKALNAKSKLGFIDGSIKKPTDPKDEDFAQWVRCDNMVNSWLLNSLSKELAASVIYAETAYEIWTDLKERFSQTNSPRIFQNQRDIISLAQEINVYCKLFHPAEKFLG